MKRWLVKRLVSCAWILVGCGGATAPVLQPHAAVKSAPSAPPRSEACVATDALRVRAETLLAEGKVARARAALDRIDTECPSERDHSVAARRAVDVALASDGRSEEAWIGDAERLLAAGDRAGAQRLFDRARLAFTAKGATPRLVDLAFDGTVSKVRWFARGIVAAHGHRVSLRDPATLGVLRMWELDDDVRSLEAEGDTIVAATTRAVVVLDAKTGARVAELGDVGAPIALRKDVLVAAETKGKTHAAVLFDATPGKGFPILRTLPSDAEPVALLALSPHATRVAVYQHGAKVYAVDTGNLLATPHAGWQSLTFGASEDELYSGTWFTLERWPLDGGIATSAQPKRDVPDIAVRPDGQYVATAGTLTVRLWQGKTLASMNVEGSMKGHTDGITTVAFAPDGELMVTGAKDRTMRVWDPRIGKAVHTIGIARAEASPMAVSNTELAYRDDGGPTRLDLSTGTRLHLASTSAAAPIALLDGGVTLVAEPFTLFDAAGTARWSLPSGGTVVRLAAEEQRALAYVRGLGLTAFALADGKNEGLLHGGPTSALSRDGRLALTWKSTSEAARILDTRKNTYVAISSLMGGDALARSVFSADGALLFVPYAFPGTTARRRFRAIDTKSGGKAWEGDLGAEGSEIDALALSPAGDTLLVARSDRSIELWSVEKRARIGSFAVAARVQDARITDGHVVLTTVDGAMTLHDRVGKMLLARVAFVGGGALWRDGEGHFEIEHLEGAERAATLGCEVASKIYPLELCEDAWATPKLVEKTLRGERIE